DRNVTGVQTCALPICVLEQAAGITMMAVGARSRQCAERTSQLYVAEDGSDDLRQACVRDLGGQELEEPVELVRVSSQRGDELRRDRKTSCRERVVASG